MEKIKTIAKKCGFRGLIISFVLSLLAFFSVLFGWLDTPDGALQDNILQKPTQVDLPIYIVAIDEATIAALGQYTDWGRQPYADLVNKLVTEDSKPSVIAFDVLFTGYKNGENTQTYVEGSGDAALVEACKRAGNVIAGTTILYDVEKNSILEAENKKHVSDCVYPFKELNDVVDVGFTNNSEENDGFVRTMFTYDDVFGQPMDSFAVAIYRKYCENHGMEVEDFTKWEFTKFKFTFTGKPGAFGIVSMIDILEGRVNVQEFDDAIVIIGGYATGFQDFFYTPIARNDKMHGVEIHANIVEAVSEGKLQRDIRRIYSAIILAVATLVFSLAVFSSNMIVGGVITALSILLQFIILKILYSNGKCMYFLAYPVFIIIAYITIIVLHYIEARKDKKKISDAFKKYVAPQVVDEVTKRGDYVLKLGGEKKHIACMFVDIRGFTPMSESLQPEQVVEILNEYLALTTNSIFKNNGTLDKFIGDATMAVFNSPFDLDDYVFRAVCTAWDIALGSQKIEETFMARFGKTVSYGIGVNCGDAVVGNVGCDFRMDYTAIGDTVNTAARLEANAKAGQILISQAVYDEVYDRVDVEPIGEIPLKGKSKGVYVWKVTNVYRDGAVKADKTKLEQVYRTAEEMKGLIDSKVYPKNPEVANKKD